MGREGIHFDLIYPPKLVERERARCREMSMREQYALVVEDMLKAHATREFERRMAGETSLGMERRYADWLHAVSLCRAHDLLKLDPTYTGLKQSEHFNRLLDMHVRSLTADDSRLSYDIIEAKNLLARGIYHGARFMMAGAPVFEASAGLTDRLKHTDFRGLMCEDVQMPCEALYLITPKSSGWTVWNEISGKHALSAVYLSLDYVSDEAGMEDLKLSKPSRVLYILAVGEWTILEGGMVDDSVAYWQLRLPDGETLQEQLPKLHTDVGDPQEWRAVTEWLVKVLCYATSVDVRSEVGYFDPRAGKLRARLGAAKGNKRKKILDELKTRIQRRKTILGPGMPRLAPELRGTGTPLGVRTRVVGHFRRVACGPGRTERRKRWIEPFWRGPMDGEVSNPKRELK